MPTLRIGGRARASIWARTLDIDLAEGCTFLLRGEDLQNSLFPAWLESSREGKVVIVYLPWSLVKQVPLPNNTGPTARGPTAQAAWREQELLPHRAWAPGHCALGFTKLISVLGLKELKCNSRVCR